MENIKLKHLAPYLPYGLKMISKAEGKSAYITTIKRRLKRIETLTPELMEVMIFLNRKPILRPLSDLTKEIEYNGEKFKPSERLAIPLFDSDMQKYITQGEVAGIPFWVSQKYFEWHFDVFSLIEKGLAIDINTLNK